MRVPRGSYASPILPRGPVWNIVAARNVPRLRFCQHDAVMRSVFIVDDHPGFLAAARHLLEADGFEVIGSAESGEVALSQIPLLRPDIVLLDIQLPGKDGFAIAEQLARDCPSVTVVLTSSRSKVLYDSRLAEAPIRGFISKADLSGANLASFLN